MTSRTLVAGVDSSTQSCKIVIRDADTGELVRQGAAPHPPGTSVDPLAWWDALARAAAAAGGLDDVAAIAVGGQQHGMVCLDDHGAVVRDALLWNDIRSAQAASDLIAELPGGAAAWAEATGSVPVASFTVTKLRWLAANEPASAQRTAAVCLPHDWLTWRLRGGGAAGAEAGDEAGIDALGIDALTTDRSDASGTGYWSPALGEYRENLVRLALGARPVLPAVLGPGATAGRTDAAGLSQGATVGVGAGDNAAAAFGVGASRGDVIVSIGTSGVVCAISDRASADPSGIVAGFADATGGFLPLVCTLNATQVLDATARLLGVDLARLSELALSAPVGAGGLVLVPYLGGERTPNRPDATGALHGLTGPTMTAAHVARAAIEGLLCGLADGLDALREQGVGVERALLVGGGARSEALRRIAPSVLGVPVEVPEPGEYVADGAARQAAWALSGLEVAPWPGGRPSRRYDGVAMPSIRARYGDVREMTARQVAEG